MKDEALQKAVLHEIANLFGAGHRVVVVHGGGPAISKLLGLYGVESEFVGGHRVTTSEAMSCVQMALRGEINGTLVRLLNGFGAKSVGLSGKDGGLAVAVKRYQIGGTPERPSKNDLGFVGNIESVNPDLLNLLLGSGYLPVLAPIAAGVDGFDYNINADIFAGAVAAALKVDMYISLTDVDGLYGDFSDPGSRISKTSLAGVKEFIQTSATDGMLPKLESIIMALEAGVGKCCIFNGTKPEELNDLMTGKTASGTIITLEQHEQNH